MGGERLHRAQPSGERVPGLKHRLSGSEISIPFDEELTIEGRNHTVEVRVLQRSRTNKMCIHNIRRERFYSKELAHGIMAAWQV